MFFPAGSNHLQYLSPREGRFADSRHMEGTEKKNWDWKSSDPFCRDCVDSLGICCHRHYASYSKLYEHFIVIREGFHGVPFVMPVISTQKTRDEKKSRRKKVISSQRLFYFQLHLHRYMQQFSQSYYASPFTIDENARFIAWYASYCGAVPLINALW